ncbi:aldose 1-epimerase [Frondihabitans sp. PhB188]|uniref:aldose 1-epimerase family protein n=1 Tax=Frondihabitans sp. PhB188 TaxID=2485200 RepID=UPI000F4A1495|nr:aldose 1-epimerase family protein [Frondihabitans sp. PhB188]ROQ37512.1 aldose 1-epimerase [Frondihabitans sp. PhB188]
MTDVAPPTGEQYHLRLDAPGGVVTAIVTEVAAGLRALEVGGVAVAETFSEHEAPPSASGITLVPWPNRVDGGTWTLDGKPQQLDITEVAKGNASHGLLRFSPYRAVSVEEHAITQSASVFPQHGYPFRLDTTVRHELVDGGMVVTHTVTGRGAGTAPIAVGAHPFFRVGGHDPASLRVTLDAATRFETNVRSIPVGTAPVAGTPFDLTGSPLLGDLDIDAGYTDIATDGEGHRHITLAAPDGSSTTMWMDAAYPYMQVFTPRNFPRDGVKGLAFAAEPMSAPANALVSGEGLVWLAPGETWTGRWGVAYSPAP